MSIARIKISKFNLDFWANDICRNLYKIHEETKYSMGSNYENVFIMKDLKRNKIYIGANIRNKQQVIQPSYIIDSDNNDDLMAAVFKKIRKDHNVSSIEGKVDKKNMILTISYII